MGKKYNKKIESGRKRTKLDIIGNIFYGVSLANLLFFGSLLAINLYSNQEEERNKIKFLRERLFGEYGLADKNKNGKPDFLEVAEVYEKLGHGKKILETRELPKLSVNDLERAVEIYESKK